VVVAVGRSAGHRLVVCAGYEERQSQHGTAVGAKGNQTGICWALRKPSALKENLLLRAGC